ncbi:MAG: methionine--tRNA ligase, partial [Bradyrhizobium sp.]
MATRAKKTVKAKSSKKAAKKAVKTAAKKAAKARASKAAKKTRKSDASKRVTKSAAKTTSKAGKKAGKKQVVAKKTVKKAAKKPTKAPAKSVARKAKVTAPAAIAVPAPAAAPPKVAKPQPKPKAPRAPKPAAAPQVATQVKAPARGNVFYITTAIAYPNGSPHIGHAYEAIATDVLARFARLDGKDVFFLTGTDEHGLKMVQTAQNEGLTPSALATRNANRFREMDERLNVSFDRFIRTTEEQHHRSSQEIWRRMEANGDIYSDTYSGWYSVRDEAYYAEEETRLNDDGVRLGPQGTPVEWVEEKSYFFRLSAYQDKLLKLYETQPDFIGPDSRKNEVVSFVRGGLRDLSISRTTFDWGVKVPGDEEHVMYVWVDALTNYITGVGFPDESDKNWRYWPADVHIIGKDIIRFHADDRHRGALCRPHPRRGETPPALRGAGPRRLR